MERQAIVAFPTPAATQAGGLVAVVRYQQSQKGTLALENQILRVVLETLLAAVVDLVREEMALVRLQVRVVPVALELQAISQALSFVMQVAAVELAYAPGVKVDVV
jgi:hypothetical protein